jgi:hypothetical protein
MKTFLILTTVINIHTYTQEDIDLNHLTSDINESLVTNVIAAKTYTKYVKESRRNEKER